MIEESRPDMPALIAENQSNSQIDKSAVDRPANATSRTKDALRGVNGVRKLRHALDAGVKAKYSLTAWIDTRLSSGKVSRILPFKILPCPGRPLKPKLIFQ